MLLDESISLQSIILVQHVAGPAKPAQAASGDPSKPSETLDQLDGRHAMCSFITGNEPGGRVPEIPRCVSSNIHSESLGRN